MDTAGGGGLPYSKQEALRVLLRRIVVGLGLDLQVRIRQSEGVLRAILAGRDSRFLTAQDGAALKGLQHLVGRILSRDERFDLVPLVEMEGQQVEFDLALKGKALEAAAEVRRTGEPVKLPPMNPFERRIVHMALRDEADLTTFSTGEGSTRRITVAPASATDEAPVTDPGAADPD